MLPRPSLRELHIPAKMPSRDKPCLASRALPSSCLVLKRALALEPSQEAAASMLAKARASTLGLRYAIVHSASLDGKRDQNSLILLRKRPPAINPTLALARRPHRASLTERPSPSTLPKETPHHPRPPGRASTMRPP